jgi:hypothetical protein
VGVVKTNLVPLPSIPSHKGRGRFEVAAKMLEENSQTHHLIISMLPATRFADLPIAGQSILFLFTHETINTIFDGHMGSFLDLAGKVNGFLNLLVS